MGWAWFHVPKAMRMPGEHSAPPGTIARVLLAADLAAPVSYRSFTDRPSTRRSDACPAEQRQDCPIRPDTFLRHSCPKPRTPARLTWWFSSRMVVVITSPRCCDEWAKRSYAVVATGDVPPYIDGRTQRCPHFRWLRGAPPHGVGYVTVSAHLYERVYLPDCTTAPRSPDVQVSAIVPIRDLPR